MMTHSIRILERSIQTLPAQLAYRKWSRGGKICGSEHVHSVTIALDFCICEEPGSAEKTKCISSACHVSVEAVQGLISLNDRKGHRDVRRALVEERLQEWLEEAREFENQQLSLLESARPTSNVVEQAMVVAAAADQAPMEAEGELVHRLRQQR